MNPPPRPPVDEATWRNRFILLQLTRIGGTVVALLGILIWHSDWMRPGGWIQVGLPLAIIGVLISFLGPNVLARKWRTPPGQ
ncbi:MAG TPA: hypothetical protein VK391_08480 [Allosphingosinicella sp.]|nr:hypothetical protein [Allosphingosinicella sp.]